MFWYIFYSIFRLVGLINIISENSIKLPDYVVVAISIIHLLKTFGLSYKNRYELIKSKFHNRENFKEFRVWKNILSVLANPQEDWKGLREDEDGLLIRFWCKNKIKENKAYIFLTKSYLMQQAQTIDE